MQAIWLFPELYCSWRWVVCVLLQLLTVESKVCSQIHFEYLIVHVYTVNEDIHLFKTATDKHCFVMETSCYMWASLCCCSSHFLVTVSVILRLLSWNQLAVTVQCVHMCMHPSHPSTSPNTHTPSYALLWLTPSLLVSIECLSVLLLFVFLWEITSQNNGPACMCGCPFQCAYWHVLYVLLHGLKLEKCSQSTLCKLYFAHWTLVICLLMNIRDFWQKCLTDAHSSPQSYLLYGPWQWLALLCGCCWHKCCERSKTVS